MGLLTSLLPRRVRGYIEAGEVLFADLDTQAERDAVLRYISSIRRPDGKASVGEWAHLGKQLRILGKPRKLKKGARLS